MKTKIVEDWEADWNIYVDAGKGGRHGSKLNSRFDHQLRDAIAQAPSHVLEELTENLLRALNAET